MTSTTAVRTIASITRLKSSALGNPRMRVTFTDGSSAITQTDGSVGYGIENPEFRDVPVNVTFSRGGRITHVATIETPAGRS